MKEQMNEMKVKNEWIFFLKALPIKPCPDLALEAFSSND